MRFSFSFLLLSLLKADLGVSQLLPNPVQTYFVPLPEDDLMFLFKTISSGLNPTSSTPPANGNVNTVLSIAIAANNTIIYYDHWEDGFESDVRLAAQSTTLIWGDGNLLNGIAPGTTDDILRGGMAIVLENNVPIPRNASQVLFDGSDSIKSSLPIALSRFAYPDTPGSLMAGAVEVFNTGSWGRTFIAPVGQSTPSITDAFEFTHMYIMAGEDNTVVFKNGIQIGSIPLNKGQSKSFAVLEGDNVTSNRPIQVDLIGADVNDNYELRWYAQVDFNDWTDEYISPVAETLGNTGFWFYNPHSFPITIDYEGGNLVSGSFQVVSKKSKFIPCVINSVPDAIQIGNIDKSVNSLNSPQTNFYSGVRFKGSDRFYALSQTDADANTATVKGQVYDWGFPMIPTTRLTSQVLVGLGRGCTQDCDPVNAFRQIKERSVVWVTPVASTTIFVDFDGDGIFDFNQRLGALMSLRLTDTKNNDNDMTGAIIASVDTPPDANGQPQIAPPVKIGVAWGQDPLRATVSDPEALDLGTAVLPLANPDVNKEVVAVINPDGSIDPFKSVDQVGDIINYRIIVSNVGFAELTNVVIDDPLVPVLQGPVESKLADGILERGETFTYTGNYTVKLSDIATRGNGDNNIENIATVSTNEFPPVTVRVETPIFLAKISGNVKEDTDADDIGNVNIPGVLITLLDGASNILATTITDAVGNYAFTGLTAGNYKTSETNLNGYIDVKDIDGGNPNLIEINGVIGGSDRTGNDFVDERPGSISGFVFENQVDGQPISQSVLTLFDSNNSILATTSSGVTGFYEFKNLIPGNYRVEQLNLSNDYENVSDYDTSPDGDQFDSDLVVDNKISVKLNSNEIDIRNDFVDRLKRGSISGVVSDDQGNLLSGAKIELIFGTSGVIETKLTGPDGAYQFTNLVPGSYTVRETNPIAYPLDISDYDNSNDGDISDSDTIVDNLIQVSLKPGEDDTDNNFQDSNNGKIKGTVKDDDGNSLVSVLITLQLSLNETVVATTLTDSNGSFLFDEVEPGDYILSEKNPVAFPVDISDRDTISDTVGGFDPTDSNVAVDNIIGVKLAPAETDDGNDFVDSNKGRITGSVKDNLENSLIGVLLELKNANGTVVKSTVTNGNGAYSFDGIPPGEYTVVETNPSLFPADISDKDNSPDGDVSDIEIEVDNKIGVTLKPGEVDSENDFVDGKNGSIAGSVKDDNGIPLSAVLIELKSGANTIRTTSTDSNGLYLFSDVSPGNYTLFEVNPPGYARDVSDKDNSNDGDSFDIDSTVDSTIKVTLQPGEDDLNNDFVDSDNGSISGTVTEDKGKPLSNVTITLVTASGGFVATSLTDIQGKYIFNDVEPGNYFVIEKNPVNFPSSIKDQDTTPDGDAGDTDTTVDNTISVTLQKSENDTGNDFVDSDNGSISGSVKDDDGFPIPNVVLQLKDANGIISATAVTNVNGQYVFNELEPGQYSVLEVQPSGFPNSISDKDDAPDGDALDTDTVVDNIISVTLTPSEEDKENNFIDSNKGTISGNVTSADGDQLSNVTITLIDSSGEIVAKTKTDSSGNYVFMNVKPGNYRVVETNPVDFPSNVSDQDNSDDGDIGDADETVDNTVAVTLQPGEDDKNNDFVDDNDGAISGSVKDDNGNPLAGVFLKLEKPDGTLVDSVTTNVLGQYTFNDVEPGKYVVKELNPSGYPDNVSDKDDSNDGDLEDNDTVVDNAIKVTLIPGELDTDNNFVDSDNGSISGSVKDDSSNPLVGVSIELQFPNGTVVASTVTGSDGTYIFPNLEPDDYILVETNPVGYPDDISDYDSSPEDINDGIPNADNKIPVTLKPGENDSGNNFVDSNDGSISGTVTDDQGSVLSKVLITLETSGGAVIKSTLTDTNGFYKFTSVEPGNYTLKEVNPVGYPLDVSDYDRSDDGDSFDTNRVVDNRIGVTLTPGEEDDNNDFVDSNNGSISGTVKDDNGNAIAGVPIQLQKSSDGSVVSGTVTDSNGAYLFANVEPGNYRVVETNLAAFPINVYDYDTIPDGDSTDSSLAVDDKVDVTLIPGEADTGNDFVDSDNGKITGNVKNDSGEPLSNVLIELKNATGVVMKTTVTNGNGEYSFGDLEPGLYTLVETNPINYPANLSDQDDSPDDSVDIDKAVDNTIKVSLQPGETDADNNFVDSDNASISGSVKDDEGLPLSNVTIQLKNVTGSVISTTATNSTGLYEFLNLEPGAYKVTEINPSGYLTDVSDGDTSNDGDANDLVLTPDNEIAVTLQPSEEDKNNDFVDSNKGSISGSVVDDQGSPLPNVLIELKKGSTTVATTTTGVDGKYLFSQIAPGSYTVIETNPMGFPSNVRDGDSIPDGDLGDSDTTPDNSILVTLQPSENDDGNNFVDSNNGSISGSVKDDNGNPIPNVILSLKDMNGTLVATAATNPVGAYVFNEVEPGDYTVVETQPLAFPKSLSDKDNSPDGDGFDLDSIVDNVIGVTLKPGESDSNNDFVDSDNGSISGTVKDDNGNPIKDVTLLLLLKNNTDAIATTKTNSNGFYSFSNVEPGDYSVIEINPTKFPSSLSDKDNSPDGDVGDSDTVVDDTIHVTIKPAEDDTDNDFVDSDRGSISGSVKDDQGFPLVNVVLTLKTSDGNIVTTVATNPTGQFVFNNIDPGDYVIFETNPVNYPIDISDGDDSDDGDLGDIDSSPDNQIKVSLTEGENDSGNNFVDSNNGVISGTVKDDQGSPLQQVVIELQFPNGTLLSTTSTDSNGVYLFPSLEPGDYIIVEKNPINFPLDLSDYDNTIDGDTFDGIPNADNKIPVSLTPGEKDDGNNFVDSNNGSISGSVKDDNANLLKEVLIKLVLNGTIVATTSTDKSGFYFFGDVEPGNYTVEEINPPNYPIDVSDFDTSDDGDSTDGDRVVDNSIGVSLKPGEKDLNNDFVDSDNGSITGSVKDDNGNPILDVSIQLLMVLNNATVVVRSTKTDSFGKYSFSDIEPGNYIVSESNLPSFPNSVSDYDSEADGDSMDSDRVVDDRIGVTLKPGETDAGNNFVDSDNGLISGKVIDDVGNAISGTLITLKDSENKLILTTLTDSTGLYTFANLEPGDYSVVETNKPSFPIDLSDFDTVPDGDIQDGNKTTDNFIGVTLKPGEEDIGNNFVDTDKGSISGTVTDDEGRPLVFVVLELKNPIGDTVATTMTNSTGIYVFPSISPGNYTIVEKNPTLFPVDIRDFDVSPDGDVSDSDTKVDNKIGVTLSPGETDTENNFVDSNKGTISGTVKDEIGSPLGNVTLTLTKPDGSTIVTVTDSNGQYSFAGLPPGDYTVTETNPPGFPGNLSDYDESPDGDSGDANKSPDNKITVTLTPGEKDDGNNFVDVLASSVPSVSPSTSPSEPPSLRPTKAPTFLPTVTGPPTNDFCEVVPDPKCFLCAPSRSLDYCKPTESLPTLIQKRTGMIRRNPKLAEDKGFWFHYIEDKIAGYLLTTLSGMPAPEIFCCVTSSALLRTCLNNEVPSTVDGIVIKATNFHSNQGVYVLVPNPSGNGTINLLDKTPKSYDDVVAELSLIQASKIIVEEFIGSSLPTEYKFHVVNGKIEAIDIITDRGGSCPCYAVVDEKWNRLDQFGCFEPGGVETIDKAGCTAIDFTTGKRRSGPVKKDLYLCDNKSIPQLDDCLKKEMIATALNLGSKIGVYIRIDMFVADGLVFVQEYTTNHMNGLRHCASKLNAYTGCVDSCFLGRAWNVAGAEFGGPATAVPSALSSFRTLSAQQQCDLLQTKAPQSIKKTSCVKAYS